MNIKKTLVIFFFSLVPLTICAGQEVNWNKKCASDIGSTSEQAVEKYNANRLLYKLHKDLYVRQYPLEEVLKEKKLVERTIKNKCIMFSISYSFQSSNLNYNESKITDFNFVTKEFDLLVNEHLQKRLRDLNEIIELIKVRDKEMLEDEKNGEILPESVKKSIEYLKK